MGAFDHSIHSRGEEIDFILVKSPPFAHRGVATWGKYIDRCILNLSTEGSCYHSILPNIFNVEATIFIKLKVAVQIMKVCY